CGGRIPDMHYYLIDFPITQASGNQSPFHNITLGVMRFDAAPLYQEERLVYRDSPYEGKYYHYHRWVSQPAQMITDKTIEQLRAANLFALVVPFPKYSRIDYLLQGTIRALEEWDEGDQWYARVQIEFEVTDRKSQQLSWHTVIEQKVPVQKKTAAEIVQGINLGVERCLVELVKQLNAHFLK
ncbi:MAG: PqiC family protein, partial [candidate division KSB1 bacterium]|nr:PqiC family protein [candidate division KSB1 bacterium]